MGNLSKRLRASVGFGAVDGDSHERAVCARQMSEAADRLDEQDAEIQRLLDIKTPIFSYRIYQDGAAWCCVDREFVNLQESVAGFGDTPEDALAHLLSPKSSRPSAVNTR